MKVKIYIVIWREAQMLMLWFNLRIYQIKELMQVEKIPFMKVQQVHQIQNHLQTVKIKILLHVGHHLHQVLLVTPVLIQNLTNNYLQKVSRAPCPENNDVAGRKNSPDEEDDQLNNFDYDYFYEDDYNPHNFLKKIREITKSIVNLRQ